MGDFDDFDNSVSISRLFAALYRGQDEAAGAADLENDANGGTEFDVLHKGPGDCAFSVVADDVIVRIYDMTGLAAGSHDYKVIPRNPQGPGSESEVSTIVWGNAAC